MSYFHATITGVSKNGLKFYINREIKSVDNVKEVTKTSIMPNGRYIMPRNEELRKKDNDTAANAAMQSNKIYQLGEGFSELQADNIKEFELLIQHLQKKGVTVEIYLHPWYPSVYAYFQSNKNYAGIVRTEIYLRNFAQKHEIIVHGSYNPQLTNSTLEDFADWFHLKPQKMLEAYNVIL